MATRFTWDPNKAKLNRQRHNVSFGQATQVFNDPYQVITENYFYEDQKEQRLQIIGMTRDVTLLLVVFIDRSRTNEEVIHIISARKAQAYEESAYRDQFA